MIVDLRLDLAEEDNRDGMHLLRELNRRRINAIVVTGYGSVPLREEADSLETITFIEKSDIGRRKEILNEIVGKIFSEMEMRDRRRGRLSDDFARGKAIGFPSDASGYPLRECLNEKIEAVFDKFA